MLLFGWVSLLGGHLCVHCLLITLPMDFFRGSASSTAHRELVSSTVWDMMMSSKSLRSDDFLCVMSCILPLLSYGNCASLLMHSCVLMVLSHSFMYPFPLDRVCHTGPSGERSYYCILWGLEVSWRKYICSLHQQIAVHDMIIFTWAATFMNSGLVGNWGFVVVLMLW